MTYKGCYAIRATNQPTSQPNQTKLKPGKLASIWTYHDALKFSFHFFYSSISPRGLIVKMPGAFLAVTEFEP